MPERKRSRPHPDEPANDMPKRTTRSTDLISNLSLTLTDLRAHFEAQLRTVERAEHFLSRCRRARDRPAFESAATSVVDEVSAIAEHRRSTQSLFAQVIADAEALRSTG